MKRIFLLSVVMMLALASGARGETLTLKECLAQAAADNRGLKARAYDETIAAAQVSLAKSAWFPRVDFQGGYTSQLDPQSIQFSPAQSFATQDANFGFFSLAISYTLLDFGRRDSRDSQTKLLREAVADQYTGEKKDLFLQVVRGYYGILQADQLLRAADEEVKRLADHLRMAQNLYEQGVVTRNDVLQAEVRLASSRQRRLSAANEKEKGWLLLNYLTARPETFRADLEDANEFKETERADDPQAITVRPEYQAQRKAVEAASRAVTESKRAFFPELFVKAGIDYVENSRVAEQAIFATTVGLRFNIFEGNATSVRLRESVARHSRDEARLDDLAAQLRLELAMAQRDATVARERITVARQAIRQAEENARINGNRYLEKVGTATEVLDAETLLTQSKVDLATARYDYQVALARVSKARGEL